MNGIKKLIIDEMYSYVGSKLNRCYIWTGLVLHDNQKYPVFLLEYPFLTLLSSPHLLHIIFILIKHLLYHKLMWAIPR